MADTPMHQRLVTLAVAAFTAMVILVGIPRPADAAVVSDLTRGDTGAEVTELQQVLTAKGFYRGSISGSYDDATAAAVMAFTKEIGATRSETFHAELWTELEGFPGAWTPARSGDGPRLEVNLTKQTMYYVVGGEVAEIFHISSGRPGYESPPGSYTIQSQISGWYGGMYYPWYYTRGLAVHGYGTVPSYPYSHGCIRTEMWDHEWLNSRFFIGMPIHIWYEPDHFLDASHNAVPNASEPDLLLSYDRSNGEITPLGLVGIPGATPSFRVTGETTSTSAGYDITVGLTVGGQDLALLYDRHTGALEFRSVEPDGTTSGLMDLSVTSNWTHIVKGDFDGDGSSDLLFYRETDGLMRFYEVSLSRGLVAITPAMNGTWYWDQLVVGDYDGDGADDIMWYRATDGLMRFYEVGADHVFAAMTPAMYGTTNWTLIPSGDFDGNGADDLMYYRAADGLYRFYDVGGDGVFSAKAAAGYMEAGWNQILTLNLDDAAGAELAFYQTGEITAGRYSPGGLVTIGEATDAPSHQVLAAVDLS